MYFRSALSVIFALFACLSFSIQMIETIDDLDRWPQLHPSMASHRDQVTGDWNRFGQLLPDLIRFSLVPSLVLDHVVSAADQSNVTTSNCRRQLHDLHRKVGSANVTALQILDSWGRFPGTGFFRGSWSALGSYDLCLQPQFESQYCTIRGKPALTVRPRFHNILHPIPRANQLLPHHPTNVISLIASHAQAFYYTSFRLGICLPQACDVQSLSSIVSTLSFDTGLTLKVHRCEQSNQSTFWTSLDRYQLGSLLTVSFVIGLCLIGTLFDHLIPIQSVLATADNDSRPSPNGSNRSAPAFEWLRCFSITRNVASVCCLSNSSDQSLQCLHGLRVLTNVWIVFGHVVIWSHREGFGHSLNILDLLRSPFAAVFLNAIISVDTFFFISGLLTSYVSCKAIAHRFDRFHTGAFLFTRYFRLTPGLVVSICGVFLLPLLGSGPLFQDTFEPIVQGCRRNWFVNLMYLQNLIDPEHICNLPTWWLSNDMQLHFMSLPVIIWLLKKQKIGHILNVLLIVSAFLCTFLVHMQRDLPPYVLPTQPQIQEYWNEYILHYLYRPYVHMGPFFIGLALGHVLSKPHFVRLSKTVRVIGWTVSLATLYSILQIPHYWSVGNSYSALTASLFDCTCRLFWGMALFWIVYACATGNGGIFASILSWSPFIPLARITYMTFLTHMYTVWWFYGTRREILYTSTETLIWNFIPILVCSYVVGFVSTICFDSPFLALLKQLLVNNRVPKSNPPTQILLTSSSSLSKQVQTTI